MKFYFFNRNYHFLNLYNRLLTKNDVVSIGLGFDHSKYKEKEKMKLGKALYQEFAQDLLDINIDRTKFGLKYYTINNSQFYFVSNLHTNFESFDGSFPTSFGNYKVEIEPKRKLFSFSPNIINPPTFTIENFSSKPSKNLVFSSSFPFMINNYHFLINGAETRDESSFFANVARPLDLERIKGEVKILLYPNIKPYLNRFMVNLRSQLAQISFIHKINSNSEFHIKYTNPTNFIKIFADISKKAHISYDYGAIINANYSPLEIPAQFAYLYDSSSIFHHNVKCLLDLQQFQVGSKFEFKNLKSFTKRFGFGQTLHQFSYAVSTDLVSKFNLQVSTSLQSPYNFICTIGLDSRQRTVNASAILLLIE